MFSLQAKGTQVPAEVGDETEKEKGQVDLNALKEEWVKALPTQVSF